ncbi:MAG: HlyD family secretion protein, partial [Acetobacteraceae bacterium]
MPDGTITAERTRLARPASPNQTIADGRPPSSRRRLVRYALMGGAALILVVGGGFYWLSGGRYISTTDAYVQANVLDLATDVSGIVEAIPVRDGAHVKAGEVLFRLDKLKFQLAVDQARAGVEQARLDLEGLKADYLRAQRTAVAQQAQVQADQATYQRYAELVKTRAVPQQEYDNARFKLQSDMAQLGSNEAQVKQALSRLDGNPDLPAAQAPAYKLAEAKLGEAERAMNHAVVRAPYDGVVTQVNKLQVGQYLPAGTAAFGLVGDDEFWVAAEPKETALTHAREGDPATITVDAYPGITWQGTVTSIAPATDQQFSLLPAQNSSGNWVKVVQRVPVRVSLKPVKDAPALSSGMSAEVSI